jgi:hypothetical protein
LIEEHATMKTLLHDIDAVIVHAADDQLTDAEVAHVARGVGQDLRRHVEAETRGFLPLLRPCLARPEKDPIAEVIEADERLEETSERFVDAASAWTQHGQAPADRERLARAGAELDQSLRRHLGEGLALLAIADDCLSAGNWDEGLATIRTPDAGATTDSPSRVMQKHHAAREHP